MNPPIPFPTPNTDPSPERSRQAAAELAEALRNDLAWAVAEEGEPSYEELEAAVDGTLDAEAAERLWQRAADDPELALELAELTALRDRLRPARPTAPAVNPSRILRLAGLAAALLLAVVGLDRSLGRPAVQPSSGELSAAAQAAPEPLYADGFESGDAASWTQ